ncbi:MAG: winged helix DNA-binding domain-containing protein [Chthoniobacteraceae bacterium]
MGNESEIARYRLINQQIASSRHKSAAELVAGFGAMQAQDYSNALWAIGLRLPDATEKEIEQAVADRKIVRTWPMRGTLHFVAAEDVRWMLALLTPRIVAGSASRCRELELDDKIFARCGKLFASALKGGQQFTREAMMQLLESDGITAGSQRGYYILWRLAQEGVLCFGPRSGKQQTFTLLDEWVVKSKKMDHDAAVAELARRYFTSHGPATLLDFAGWSGLKVSDARAGLESITRELSSMSVDDTVYWMPRELPDAAEGVLPEGYLLPGFDEYLLGYKERSAVLELRHAQKVVPGSNGIFLPTLMIDGRIAGTWKRAVKKNAVVITISPFATVKKIEKKLAAAAGRYSRFTGLPVEIQSAASKTGL